MKSISTHRNLFVVALSFVLFSCADKNPSELVGTWEIDTLKITMNSYRNSDSMHVVEATARNWEQKMSVRNIQTYYNADGTYHSVHKNLQDSMFYDPAGTWKIEDDSLVIQDTIPQRITYRFKIKLDESTIAYWGVADFDQDGKADDNYYSKQRKIK